MAKTYPSKGSKRKWSALSDEDHIHTSKLIRSFAEIEDRLTLLITLLSGTSEVRATTLMGKANISTKFRIAEELARITPKADALSKLAMVKNAGWTEILNRRNVLAHGSYVGTGESGHHHFFTNNAVFLEDGSKANEVHGIRPESIKEASDWADQMVQWMDQNLNVQALRETRLQQETLPHPKARHSRRKPKDAALPPQPSEE